MPDEPDSLPECDHGLVFDEKAWKDENCSPKEVRRRWPRLNGPCPHCSFQGIAYVNFLHYLAGDW